MFKRVFIWTCDYCSKSVEKHDYGLPKGWVAIPPSVLNNRDTTHACSNMCAKQKIRLYIDDIRPVPHGFDAVARNYKEAIDFILSGNVSHISFDHDLGNPNGFTGYDIARFIEQSAFAGTMPKITWEIHSANPVGAKNIKAAMQSADRLWNNNQTG